LAPTGPAVGAFKPEDGMSETIAFKLNDRPVKLTVDGERTLLWVLRTDLALTGVKFGCGEGHCGCCAILVNNRAVRSCLLRVKDVQGKDVVTIEGLEKDGKLHPLQKAFCEHDGMQCGYCTPGMIITGVGFLLANPTPSRQDIARGLEKNLCRCGAHTRILDAMESAATEMRGGR
jgi:aerobic-type carbon monoxide dehydrogenase small subunit (CoxS/CutS family)